MGYKTSFLDNASYSAQDVNEALSHLTKEGVAIFSDSGDIISDLNSAVAEITNSGTIDGSCKVVNNNGTYKITKGTCFMNDGSQITFDNDGYVIERIENVKNYIYLSRNELFNRIDIVVSKTAGGTDTVPLAEIESDGSVKDTRKFASAKIAMSSGNITRSGSVSTTGITETGVFLTLDMGFSGFKYLVFDGNFPSTEINGRRCVYLQEGIEQDLPYQWDDSYYNGNAKVRKAGRTLVFTKKSTGRTISNLSFEVI